MQLILLGRQFDDSGDPLSGGKAYFRLSGSSTPATVYADADLVAELSYPVVADAGGMFPAIYLDPSLEYRFTLTASDGSLSDPITDVDPVNTVEGLSIDTENIVDGAVTEEKCVSTLVTDLLGYTPANLAGDTFTGPVRLGHTPTSLYDNEAGFRAAPQTTKDAAYTFVLDDAGRTLAHTSGSAHAWVIPPNSAVAFPKGTVVVVINLGAGAVTLDRGAGVVLRQAGSATDADLTLAQHGLATLFKADTDVWYASGAGLS